MTPEDHETIPSIMDISLAIESEQQDELLNVGKSPVIMTSVHPRKFLSKFRLVAKRKPAKSAAEFKSYKTGKTGTIFTVMLDDHLSKRFEERGVEKLGAVGQVVDTSLVFEGGSEGGKVQAYKPRPPDTLFGAIPEPAVTSASRVFETSRGSGVVESDTPGQPTALELDEVFTVFHRHYDSRPSRSTLLLWDSLN